MSTVVMLQISQERFQREGQVEKTCSKKAGGVSPQDSGRKERLRRHLQAWPGQRPEAKGEEWREMEMRLACGEGRTKAWEQCLPALEAVARV